MRIVDRRKSPPTTMILYEALTMLVFDRHTYVLNMHIHVRMM